MWSQGDLGRSRTTYFQTHSENGTKLQNGEKHPNQTRAITVTAERENRETAHRPTHPEPSSFPSPLPRPQRRVDDAAVHHKKGERETLPHSTGRRVGDENKMKTEYAKSHHVDPPKSKLLRRRLSIYKYDGEMALSHDQRRERERPLIAVNEIDRESVERRFGPRCGAWIEIPK